MNDWRTCQHEYKPDKDDTLFCRNCGNDQSLIEATEELVTVVEYALTITEHLRAYSNVMSYIGDAAINRLESMAQIALRKAEGEEA